MRRGVVMAVAVAFLMTACGGGSDAPDPGSSGTGAVDTSDPVPPVAAPTPEPEVDLPDGYVDLTDDSAPGGVQVGNAGDLASLDATTADFREFIDTTLGAQSTGWCQQAPSVTVSGFDPAGFATGAMNTCDPYAAWWAKLDGSWVEVAAAAGVPPCEPLESVGFPAALVGAECLASDGSTRAYR